MKFIIWIFLIWGVVCGVVFLGNYSWNLENVLMFVVCMLLVGFLMVGYI